ncbi:CBS domain-containing protein [Streptomyces sp. PA5.6]|uniref:CBS domain-containing protein n=1 Tax=Streptomyces sp. PA5.6 TaxID=3035651 RepID=UPI003904B5F5
MTLVQMQPHPMNADTTRMAVADAAEEARPRVWGDMTVEVALSVMAGARVGRLLLCDEDGKRIGLITLARLTAIRDSSGYTNRIRLRDIGGGSGPTPSPTTMPTTTMQTTTMPTNVEAGHPQGRDRLGTPPAGAGHPSALDVLAFAR